MNYHIVLDMTSEEIKEVKKVAVDADVPVKELVKQAILFYMVRKPYTILGITNKEEKPK